MSRLVVLGSTPIVRQHIDAANSAGFNVVAIASRRGSQSSSKLAADLAVPLVQFDSVEIARLKPDAVLIATAPESLLELLLRLTSLNIPILVEKPLFTSSSQFEQLLNLDLSRVIVGYNRRHYSSVMTLKSRLSNKNNYDSFWNISELVDVKSTKLSQEDITKAILNNTVHYLDLMFFIHGELVDMEILQRKRRIEWLREAMFYFENGSSANFRLTFHHPISNSVDFFLDRTIIQLKPFEIFQQFDKMSVVPISDNNKIKRYTPEQTVPWTIAPSDEAFKPGFLGQYLELNSLIKGGLAPISARVSDAYRATKLAEQLIF